MNDNLGKVTMKEILSLNCVPARRFITDLKDAAVLVEQLKRAGYRMVIVGGVWDLPHIGHAKYLQLAREQGDVLIVVVDSDELVKDRKGPSRPVVPEEQGREPQARCWLATQHRERRGPQPCPASRSQRSPPPSRRR